MKPFQFAVTFITLLVTVNNAMPMLNRDKDDSTLPQSSPPHDSTKIRIWNSKTGQIEQHDSSRHLTFPTNATPPPSYISLNDVVGYHANKDKTTGAAYVAHHNERFMQKGADHLLNRHGGIHDQEGYHYTSSQMPEDQAVDEVWQHKVGKHGMIDLRPSQDSKVSGQVHERAKHDVSSSATSTSPDFPPAKSQKR